MAVWPVSLMSKRIEAERKDPLPAPVWIVAGQILEQMLLELGPPENPTDSARRARIRSEIKKHAQ